jgi:hypothetical protein
VLAVLADGQPAFATCITSLARIEFVRGALGMSGLAALARDFLLLAAVHRCKTTIAAA